MTAINLTPQQRIEVEKHSRYKENLRQAVIDQAIYWNGNNGYNGTDDQRPTVDQIANWFKHRSLAESVLADTNKVDVQFWLSLSAPRLKEQAINMDLPENTPTLSEFGKIFAGTLGVEFVVDSMIAAKTFDTLATVAFDEQAKTVPF
ncbi:MAG TPA: hypothetical protein VK658_14830 [Chryseolinea sp.]|nr:hypothetical protein [Chryseolinea sp.]